MKYRPQLDALRAFAIAPVLCAHLAPVSPRLSHLGVRLFFVLSGFLITDILLNQRSGVVPFYVRRAARLWPLLYAALLAAILLDLEDVRATALWHLAQLTNLKIYRIQSWSHFWPVLHLWTLNVEAQFYLVWPLVIRLTPRRALKPVLWALVLLAPAYRYATGFDGFASVLPPASLDALGAGALLALGLSRPWVYALAALGAAAAVAGAVAGVIAGGPAAGAYEVVEFAAVGAFCGLVLAAYDGNLGWIERPWLVHLGRISYGVYILHAIVWATMLKLGWPFPRGAVNLLAVTAVTVALAAASYTWFESPIRRYASRRSARRPGPETEAARG